MLMDANYNTQTWVVHQMFYCWSRSTIMVEFRVLIILVWGLLTDCTE